MTDTTLARQASRGLTALRSLPWTSTSSAESRALRPGPPEAESTSLHKTRPGRPPQTRSTAFGDPDTGGPTPEAD